MNSVRLLRPDELEWANARYAEIDFLPSGAADLVAVAEVDGERAGLGRVVPVSPTAGELGGMYVFPPCRGRGVAQALVAFLLAQAPRERLYCIPFAHLGTFYGSFGFEPVAPGEALPAAVAEKFAWCQSHYPEPVLLLARGGYHETRPPSPTGGRPMGDMIEFPRPDGQACNAYYVRPADGPTAPAVVVIQEWWGLNPQIRGVADRLAQAGYRAIVPDLYRGKVTLEAAEAEHLMQGLDFMDAATQDVRGALQHMKQTGSKAAVMGFCMGGALAILAGIHAREADAVVSWYGVPPPEAGDPGSIGVPVQGHFALEDAFFPIAMAERLEARLKEAGVPHEFHRYAAQHAFGNENNASHDPQATALAWQRSLDFLARHLR